MEETIDLREYFGIIRKKLWIIGLIASIAIVVSGVVSFFVIKPVYKASTTLIVNTTKGEEESAVTGDQLNVTQKLAVTYGEIIKSRAVLEPVIQKLGLDLSYEGLVSKVSVSPVKDTQIIQVSVEDINPSKAKDIANQITQVFKTEAIRITKANSVEVVDKATLPANPIKPNKVMNVAIAAVLGVMIGLFVVFLIEYMDKKMKTPQDIEKYLGIPLLGVIPKEKSEK